jgi:hypothetical protein
MPYTVEGSFTDFFSAINLTGDHRETANARRDRIVSILGNHFEILEAFSTGSIPKYTALKDKCDLDLMVVLHYGKHVKDKAPSQVLSSVRDKLGQNRTGARRNGQAVTLYYETWPNVDIVPVARFVDGAGNVTHYAVPDANTGLWIESRPKEFAAGIESKASTCGPNFRRIIKMVKHWNRTHGDYLQSYHIEVLALQALGSVNLDDTPWQVYCFFKDARALLTNKIWYDRGFADDYLSIADRQEALKRCDTAIGHSLSGWHELYKDKNNHKAAIENWKKLFGDKFPAYG